MPMGIVSDSEFDSEVNNSGVREKSNSIPQPPKIQRIEKGRGEGNLGVPDSLRKVIGETAISDGRADAVELGSMFGISSSSVSAYTNGATSTATYDKKPNFSVIQRAKDKIAVKARNKLKSALNALTEEKLNETKARELAGIAKDMSVVVKNMEGEQSEDKDNTNKPQFIFYAPTVVKTEQNFEVVYSKDER